MFESKDRWLIAGSLCLATLSLCCSASAETAAESNARATEELQRTLGAQEVQLTNPAADVASGKIKFTATVRYFQKVETFLFTQVLYDVRLSGPITFSSSTGRVSGYLDIQWEGLIGLFDKIDVTARAGDRVVQFPLGPGYRYEYSDDGKTLTVRDRATSKSVASVQLHK